MCVLYCFLFQKEGKLFISLDANFRLVHKSNSGTIFIFHKYSCHIYTDVLNDEY